MAKSPQGESSKTVRMTKGKVCKSCVRYESANDSDVVTNIYLDKSFAPEMPEMVDVTVSSVTAK